MSYFYEYDMLEQEKSQEKKEQPSDAQRMRFETSFILVKKYSKNQFPVQGDSNESLYKGDVITLAITQEQEFITTSKLKKVIKKFV